MQRVLTSTPTLRGHWLTGTLDERRKHPLAFFARMSALGDVASTRFLWIRVFTLNHPDAVKHVFVDHAQRYSKGRTMRFMRPLLGEGLFSAEGELWKRNRRLAQPAFHRERLSKLVDMMAAATGQMLDRWERDPVIGSGGVFDVMPEMMALTMSIVARALFSSDVSADASEVGRALTFVIEETNRRILAFNPLALLLPGRRKREFDRAIALLDSLIFRIIEGRRKEGGPKDDLLAMLMEAQDADTGERMSDRQLRDEVMTLFLAGHETTAVALCWLWSLLAQHPDVERRMRAEIDEALGKRVPTAADLPKLPYTLMVIEETLRLYPPVWVIPRESLEDDVIMGHPIPAGSIIVTSPWAMHHSAQYWPDPERFDPERFTPERSAGRPKLAYLPFGTGQRMCIGNSFALMEAQVIAAMALQRFRVSLPAGARVEPDPQVTLRPRGGMHVAFEPLNSTRARPSAA